MKKIAYSLIAIIAVLVSNSINTSAFTNESIDSTSSHKHVLTKMSSNESDYQLQMRQDILDYLEGEKNLSVSINNDGGLLVFEEDGITYRINIELAFDDNPYIIYIDFYVFTKYDGKYDSRVYTFAQRRMHDFRTIKALYDNDDKYFVISSDMYLANSYNFKGIFDKTKALLKHLYSNVLPEECNKAQYYLSRNR